jgi:hypothetical protein
VPRENTVILLARLGAPVAALVAVMLFAPAPASGQDIVTLRVDRDRPSGYTSGGTEAAAQDQVVRDLTAAVQRLLKRVDVAQETALNVPTVNDAGVKTAFRFRVGMFFEVVTQRMVSLFAEIWASPTCRNDLVQDLESELKVLEKSGGGDGAVFGRRAVAAVRKRCPV